MGSLLFAVLPLALGAALVLAAFSLVCVTALERLRPHHSSHTSWTDAAVLLASGALLGLLALRSLSERPNVGEKQPSRIAERLQTASTGWFVGVGALGMVVNFSTLPLVLSAVHEITHSTAAAAKVTVFAVLYVIVLLPVLVPVLAVTVLGARVDRLLDATHTWIGSHSRTIGVVIEVVFAAYTVIKGIKALP